jgi:hypothetical protein
MNHWVDLRRAPSRGRARRWSRVLPAALAAIGSSSCALLGGFDLSGYSESADAAVDVLAASGGTLDATSAAPPADGSVAVRDQPPDAASGPLDSAPPDGPTAAGNAARVDGGSDADAGNGAVVPVDAPSNDPGIFCEGTYCNPADSLCCSGIGTTDTDTCLSGGAGAQCPSPTVRVECDDTYDCEAAGKPATVCCGIVGGTNNDVILEATCIDAGGCGGNNSYAAVLCDPAAAAPCLNAAKCVSIDAGPLSACTGH